MIRGRSLLCEHERIVEERLVAYFKAILQYPSGRTEKSTKNLSDDSCCPGRDPKQAPPA
jgi:hypothetical protein